MRRTKLQLWNPKTIERLIEEGRGRIEGQTYIPWIDVRSFSSRGLCHRIPSWKCGRRVIQLFSILEYEVALLLDWLGNVQVYYEQYPLHPLEETLEIAYRLGVRPVLAPHVQKPIVLTSDFLIKMDRFVVYWVKPAGLLSPRELEKYEIARVYWARRNIKCLIFTEEQLPKALIGSIRQVHKYYYLHRYPFATPGILTAAESILRSELGACAPMARAAARVDADLRLKRGSGIVILKHLLARKVLPLDPSRVLNLSEPLGTLCKS